MRRYNNGLYILTVTYVYNSIYFQTKYPRAPVGQVKPLIFPQAVQTVCFSRIKSTSSGIQTRSVIKFGRIAAKTCCVTQIRKTRSLNMDTVIQYSIVSIYDSCVCLVF